MPANLRSSLMLVALLLLLGRGASYAQEAPAAAGPPYRVGGDVTRPEKISGIPPVYTELARKARVMGVVIVEAIIDEQGNVTETRVLKGLPMGLDRAAVEAVETWKFKPATLDGRPVPVFYVLTVNFQVQSDLSFGPLFRAFMQENPEFRDLVAGKRYEEALGFLDRRAAERQGDPGIHLARSYVYLALEQLDEAWQEAQAYDGPEPYETFLAVAGVARDMAPAEADEEVREGIVELGLQAVDRALAARTDDLDALVVKRHLLWEKTKLTPGEEGQQELLEKANELQKRIDELRSKKGTRPPIP